MYICTVETENGNVELLFHMNKLMYLKYLQDNPDAEERSERWKAHFEKLSNEPRPTTDKDMLAWFSKSRMPEFIDEVIAPLVKVALCKERKTSTGEMGFRPATPAEVDDFMYSDAYAEFIMKCFNDDNFAKEFIDRVYYYAKQQNQ